MIKKLTALFLFTANAFVTTGQITDSVLAPGTVKAYLYRSLPDDMMLNSAGVKVNYMEFIKANRP